MARPKRKSTIITKHFADNLSDLVEEKKKSGKSHNDIAEEIEVGSATLSDWMADNKTPTIDNLYKISKYFDVSADWLLGLTNHRTTSMDTRAVCEFTGLSQHSVQRLFNTKNGAIPIHQKLIDAILSTGVVERAYDNLIDLVALRLQIHEVSNDNFTHFLPVSALSVGTKHDLIKKINARCSSKILLPKNEYAFLRYIDSTTQHITKSINAVFRDVFSSCIELYNNENEQE